MDLLIAGEDISSHQRGGSDNSDVRDPNRGETQETPTRKDNSKMSQGHSEKLSEKDKIQILLQEYGTLRSELVSNGNRQFQIAALAGVLFTLTLSRPIERRFWIATLIGVIALCYFGVAMIRDIRRLARRVSELEAEINRRAGEELLIWKSRWGAGVTGFVFRRSPLPPKSARQRHGKKAKRLGAPN